MALDTGGNQAVDYVWGNHPMQPNTDRKTSLAVELTTNDATAGGYPISRQMHNVSGTLPAEVKVGAPVQVSGFTNPALNISSTVYAIYPSEPFNAIILEAPFVAQAFQENGTLTFDATGSFGGGTGDYGWGKTVSKPSLQLDPALDGHNIATSFWNNFPGYTPNAGFIPQQVWQGTITSQFQSYVIDDAQDSGNQDPYGNNFSAGYVMRLTSSSFDEADANSLSAAVTSNALIGERVPQFSFLDSYGNTVTIPMGHIVGVDTEAIGVFNIYTIKVAVDNFVSVGYREFPLGTEITLGLGAPKQVLVNAVIGTDLEYVMLNHEPTGEPGFVRFVGANNDVNNLSAEIMALTAQNGMVANGGYFAVSEVSTSLNQGEYMNFKTNFYKIHSAVLEGDMYGNPYAVKIVFDDASVSSPGMGFPSSDFIAGDTVVVIK